jgi:hypothetical protein
MLAVMDVDFNKLGTSKHSFCVLRWIYHLKEVKSINISIFHWPNKYFLFYRKVMNPTYEVFVVLNWIGGNGQMENNTSG